MMMEALQNSADMTVVSNAIGDNGNGFSFVTECKSIALWGKDYITFIVSL